MNGSCIIGIAGGTASGKTTIVNILKSCFSKDLELISHDFYYRPHDDLAMEERAQLNYDHPSAFDTEQMIADIKKLRAGEMIFRPIYDYTHHTRAKENVRVLPKKIILLEGILILEDKRLRDLMDIKVFVDADADERLMRRITRDMKDRGRSIDSILKQYRETVKPMHEQFIEPSKKYADIIIPRGGRNTIAINILMQHMQMLLQNETGE